MRTRVRDKEWEIKQSSLFRIKQGNVTYEECRRYASEDIVNNLTRIFNIESHVIELPYGTDFHFLGRVYTGVGSVNVERYYEQFSAREFVGFSSINKKNVSHYKGDAFFVYDILPEDIVHIFPIDSDTERGAINEDELTYMPSLWLTLNELESLTYDLKAYNQITCRTKRNGEILKPYAIIAFEEVDDYLLKLAIKFNLNIIIIHKDEDAINYNKDLLCDVTYLNRVVDKMVRMYGLYEVGSLAYFD